MVVVPGTEGNFGVLPGHAPLISTIRPGTIDIYEGNAITERIFVAGGFAEVTPERCTVLADEAMPPDSLDRAAARSRIADDRRQPADACATRSAARPAPTASSCWPSCASWNAQVRRHQRQAAACSREIGAR